MADIVGTIAAENTLTGNLNAVLGKDGKSAYEVALSNGFVGTEEEWLKSLKGESGVYVGAGDMPEDCNVQIDLEGEVLTLEQLIKKVISQVNKISFVTLPASAWQGETSPFYQVVNIEGTTENSKIDLNPTVEQLNIFHEKDVSFVVANNKGVITVYCVGQKPANDYTIQVSITEVKTI
jgi:hypothetical protein